MAHKIAIIYGFGEGQWHGHQFTRRLLAANFAFVEDVEAADIVIAHSAGAFYTPKLRDNQTIMFINPTYWPGRNPVAQMIAKVAADCRYNAIHHPIYLLQKTSWNILYILKDWRRSKEIITLSKNFDLLAVVGHHRTIIVRNHADTWLTNDLEHLQAANPKLRLHRLPGEHDDCWLHPDSYINLLQSDT